MTLVKSYNNKPLTTTGRCVITLDNLINNDIFMHRNTFINDDTSTTFAAVDLAKSAVLGIWNLTCAIFFSVGAVSEACAGMIQAVLEEPKKANEHFSDAKADVIETGRSIVEVCKNFYGVALNSAGIVFDVVGGLMWAGGGLVSGAKSVVHSVVATYENWTDPEGEFCDAFDTTPEVEEFFDAPLAFSEDVSSLGDLAVYDDNVI